MSKDMLSPEEQIRNNQVIDILFCDRLDLTRSDHRAIALEIQGDQYDATK